MSLAELPILTIVTFLPLLGALVVAVLPTGWTRPVALAFALATWVVSLLMLIGYLPGRAGSQFLFIEASTGSRCSASSTSSASTGCRRRWSS